MEIFYFIGCGLSCCKRSKKIGLRSHLIIKLLFFQRNLISEFFNYILNCNLLFYGISLEIAPLKKGNFHFSVLTGVNFTYIFWEKLPIVLLDKSAHYM